MLAAITLVTWNGARVWRAWQGVERVEFDLVLARDRLSQTPAGSAKAPLATTLITEEYDTVLAIGSDERPIDQVDRQTGIFADAVILFLRPNSGEDPLLVSLPRDLIVTDPCTGRPTKLNRTLNGCGDEVSGAEHVALAVEDFTGIAVDHYAEFGFDAFEATIDAVGGVEICVKAALRDFSPELLREGNPDLVPAGCSVLDGDTALRWIRSRTTQELVDGEWHFVEGVSDATRASRQQQMILALLGQLMEIRSPASLAAAAEHIGGGVVFDESLSFGEAVAMVWGLRGIPASQIRRVFIPTEPAVLDDGSFALRATDRFAVLIGG